MMVKQVKMMVGERYVWFAFVMMSDIPYIYTYKTTF